MPLPYSATFALLTLDGISDSVLYNVAWKPYSCWELFIFLYGQRAQTLRDFTGLPSSQVLLLCRKNPRCLVCEVGDRKPSKINQEDCNPLGTELKLTPTDKIWITYVCKRSLTVTEILDTSVKLKRTSRFPRPFQTTGDVCDSVFTLKSAKFRTTRKEWKSNWIREICWKNRSRTSYERHWARSCMAG